MAVSSGGRIRVLHVDDEPDFAELTAQFLEREDDRLAIETATSAEVGLDRIEERPPDCIVSDYNMPDMDGLEFLAVVRETYPDLPFILFTGKGSEAVASDAISAGVTDYLQKGSGSERYELLANRIDTVVRQYRTERELERQNDLFSKAQNIADVGVWEYDVATDTSYVSAETMRIHGLSPDDDLPPERSMEYYHPEDRPAIRDAFERAIEDGEPYDLEVRLIDDDGRQRWVRTRGDPQFDDGTVSRLRGTLQDITDSKQREHDLERYREMVEASGDAIYALDPDGYVTMVNDTFVEWSGYPREELLDAHVSQFMPESDVRKGRELIAEILSDPERSRGRFEMRAVRPDDEVRYYEDSVAVLTDEDGALAGSVGVIRDITERKRREDALAALQESTRAFIDARDPESIAEAAVETACTALDQPVSALWFHDPEADVLSPAAASDEAEAVLGSLPTYTGADSLSWQAFRTDEVMVYDDVSSEPDRLNPDTPIRSEIIVPLGDHGVMNLGTTERTEFTDADVSLARILGNTVEAALSRVERE